MKELRKELKKELKKELRKEQIAIRLTETEKDTIETISHIRDQSMAEFVREAIFSHIYNLNQNNYEINLDFILNKFEEINKNIENINILMTIVKNQFSIPKFQNIKIEGVRYGQNKST